MKKFITLLLSFVLLFSVTAFANETHTYNTEPSISVDGEVIPGLIPLPDDYPVPEYLEKARTEVEGFYIAGDGVAARRPYGLDAPIIGRLYTGDIVWTKWETAKADGYTWVHVDADQTSNMGKVQDLWIVSNYIGEPWSLRTAE